MSDTRAGFAALHWCVHERPALATVRDVPLSSGQWALSIPAAPLLTLPLGPSAAVTMDIPVPAAVQGVLTLHEIVTAAAAYLQHYALSRAELAEVAAHEEACGDAAAAAAIRAMPRATPPLALLPSAARWRGVVRDAASGIVRVVIH